MNRAAFSGDTYPEKSRSVRGKRFACLLLAALWAGAPALAQVQEQEPVREAVSVRALGISYHLRTNQKPQLFPNRLDSRGLWVANFGLIAGYERFVKSDAISIRVQQSFYSDCAASLGGFTHLGFRGRMLKAGRHELIGGIGPTLVYRQDWNRLEGYQDDGYFNRHGRWQYRFYWYAGELEYYYTLHDRHQLGLTVIPGIPELMLFGVGYRRKY